MLNRGGLVSSIHMNLSKACDCQKGNLLLAKLQAYGFSKKVLRLFLSYLTNHMQGTKIGSTFCDWTNIVKSIPHSSTLSLLLFDIFISD